MNFTKSSIIGEIILETQYYTAKHAVVTYMKNQYSKGLHMKDFKEDLVNLSDNLVYKPIHESTIWQIRPELLNEIKYYDGYGSVSE